MSNEIRIESFANRLKIALNIRGITAAELATKTGLSKAQLSQYTNGVYEAKQKALYILAQALGLNEAWLMGYDVPMDKDQLTEWEEKYNPNGKLVKETKVCELIQEQYGVKTLDVVTEFQKLDEIDQSKILERIDVLLEDDKYSIKKESKNA